MMALKKVMVLTIQKGSLMIVLKRYHNDDNKKVP